MEQPKIFKLIFSKNNGPVTTNFDQNNKPLTVFKVNCNICNIPLSDKYALLFHLAAAHKIYKNVCPKCFGVFTLIDNHISKCSFPYNNNISPDKMHKLILKQRKLNKK